MSENKLHNEAGMPAARLFNEQGQAPVVLVCEHASNRFPTSYQALGLNDAARQSHAAWDPGAQAVAETLAMMLDARLVESTVSRLVYDCNRPPEDQSAMPARSELFDIPGNRDLGAAERARRVRMVYEPFRDLLAETLRTPPTPRALITIHSFTPVYMGDPRDVEIGVLHDRDSRVADAMMATAPAHTRLRVERNAPYGPADGVTHTLKEHGLKNDLLNIMLEIRNDLIKTPEAQREMAAMLAHWLAAALASQGVVLQVAEPLNTIPKELGCRSSS